MMLGAHCEQFYAQTHRYVKLFHKKVYAKLKYYKYLDE